MLIVAIPKSASTSLMKTLGELHPHITVLQDFSFRENNIPDSSNQIHLVHSDVRELTYKEVLKFGNNETIYKQHIYPTKNNLKALKDIRKVVLLRSPDEILKAYKRGARKHHNSLPPGYNARMKTKEVLKRSKKDGFYEDLNYFFDTWIHYPADKNTLIIHYTDYLQDPTHTINKIEKFFDLPLTKDKVIPAKARYSKLTFKDHFQNKKKRLKTLLVSILSVLKLK